MVGLFLVSVAVLAWVVWAYRRLPRPFVPPTGVATATSKQPAPPSVGTQHAAPSAPTAAARELDIRALDDAPPLPQGARAELHQAGRDAVNAALRRVLQPQPPATPSATAAAVPHQWIPLGQTVQLRNVSINGGGFYFGSSTAAPAGCVNPNVAIDFKNPDWTGKSLGYWPNYERINAAQRGAYVGWLNSKRDTTVIGIGYVFLQFYCLERRLLRDWPADPTVQHEAPALLAELDRLRSIYGALNASYAGYAARLRDTAAITFGLPAELSRKTAEWTLPLLVGVGARIRGQQPLTSAEAFAIARTVTAEGGRSKWDVVLNEVFDLFELRYRRSFPEGLVIVSSPRQSIAVDYRWAANDGGQRPFAFNLPDPSAVTTAYHPLSQLLTAALLDIEPLRKARKSKNATPTGELAAMPAELRGTALPPAVAQLRDQVMAAIGAGPSAGFGLAHVMQALSIPAGTLTKKTSTAIVQTLSGIGIGIEPDPRFNGIIDDTVETVEVFHLDSAAPRAPSPAYATAQLLAHAAMSMANATTGIQQSEIDALITGIERQFALTPQEHNRLRAHVACLKRTPPTIARIEARARLLPESDRRAFAQVLIDIAGADGHVSPAEIKLLEAPLQVIRPRPDARAGGSPPCDSASGTRRCAQGPRAVSGCDRRTPRRNAQGAVDAFHHFRIERVGDATGAGAGERCSRPRRAAQRRVATATCLGRCHRRAQSVRRMVRCRGPSRRRRRRDPQ